MLYFTTPRNNAFWVKHCAAEYESFYIQVLDTTLPISLCFCVKMFHFLFFEGSND